MGLAGIALETVAKDLRVLVWVGLIAGRSVLMVEVVGMVEEVGRVENGKKSDFLVEVVCWLKTENREMQGKHCPTGKTSL